MTIRKLDKQFCTACEACANKCPVDAIQMVSDVEGFFYPKILGNCINCDVCERVCPQISFTKTFKCSKPQNGRLAVGKDNELISYSASGGAFAVFGKYIIEKKDGIVFGACMDPDFFVRHRSISKIEEIKLIQGSKYVQSNIGITFRECKKFLECGRYVLFSGTPCQLAGLKEYLGKHYENLLTVDIVCHGVAAPMAFIKYIRWLENKIGSTIVSYRFRNHTPYSKMGYIARIDYEDKLNNRKTIWRNSNCDIFFQSYLEGKLFRNSCYSCIFARNERVSDITIGDCNSYRYYRDFHPYEASSIILFNTPKGQLFWEEISEQFDSIELDVDRELKMNNQLHGPSKKPIDRDIICQEFAIGLFEKYEKVLLNNISFIDKICFWLQRHIPFKYRFLLNSSYKKLIHKAE